MAEAFASPASDLLAQIPNAAQPTAGQGLTLDAAGHISPKVLVGYPVIAFGTKTSSVSSAGTTFGAGADILASALSFTADGTSSYAVQLSALSTTNNTNTVTNFLHLNLDGADAGIITQVGIASLGFDYPVPCRAVITPAAGSHTVNVRLRVNGGTGSVNGGAGGAATALPILVTVMLL